MLTKIVAAWLYAHSLPLVSAYLLPRQEQSTSASLPNITILATGGTIAGESGSTTANSGYDVSASISQLIDAVPELLTYANLDGYQLSEVGSTNMNQTILLQLHKAVLGAVADPNIAGVVLTHGSDTLEEVSIVPPIKKRS
jgi:L-asparaginase